MIAGGITLTNSDANNEADDVAMITEHLILIDYN